MYITDQPSLNLPIYFNMQCGHIVEEFRTVSLYERLLLFIYHRTLSEGSHSGLTKTRRRENLISHKFYTDCIQRVEVKSTRNKCQKTVKFVVI